MKLNIIIDGRSSGFNVPDAMLTSATEFFDKLDEDMDKGWQMSRDWVDNPNKEQRCQIVADKMLTAIQNDNEKYMMLLCAYVLKKIPGITAVDIDINGEMDETEFIYKQEPTKPLGPIFN